MATCRECLHIDICSYKNYQDAVATGKDKEVFITIRNNIACRFFTPKSEYVKRERGEWHLLDECANEGVYCSVCHKKVYRVNYANQKLKSNFCPNCGADMRKENNNG